MKKLDEILDMCPNFYDRESFANGYLKGYEQAEKDLELTWEDIDWIVGEAVLLVTEDSVAKQVCKEVLKRFNEQRDEDKH